MLHPPREHFCGECRGDFSCIIGTGNAAMETAVGVIPATAKRFAADTYSIAGVAAAAEGGRFVFSVLIVSLMKHHAIT